MYQRGPSHQKQLAQDQRLIVEKWGVFCKGFKAPYWETSPGLYQALLEKKYWIADHNRNDKIRPKNLDCYKLGPDSWHGHIQNDCGNGLEEAWDKMLKFIKGEKEFKFISEVVWPGQQNLL